MRLLPGARAKADAFTVLRIPVFSPVGRADTNQGWSVRSAQPPTHGGCRSGTVGGAQQDGSELTRRCQTVPVANVLDREMYTEPGAARLLGIPLGTLHYWLEGGKRRGKTYKPVIREQAIGARTVTWAEFVEAG